MSERVQKLEQENEALQSRLNELEDAINNNDKDKNIGYILSGPMKKGKHYLYLCNINGTKVICTSTLKELEEGDEVLILGGVVVHKMYKELKLDKNNNIPKESKLCTWKDIIGLDDELGRIQGALETVFKPEEMEAFGIEPTKGILLWGPPGNGKTLIAKAIATDFQKYNKCDTNEQDFFFYIKGAELLDKYVGETESKVLDIFKRAREYEAKTGNKAVIFIDEAEAILGRRGEHILSGTVVPVFLSEMDGFNQNTPLLILATNKPGNLDEAVIRPGRVDVMLEIKRPNEAASKAIYQYYIDKKPKATPVKNLYATHTAMYTKFKSRMSGALVANVVNTATNMAYRRFSANKKKEPKGLIEKDLLNAIESL